MDQKTAFMECKPCQAYSKFVRLVLRQKMTATYATTGVVLVREGFLMLGIRLSPEISLRQKNKSLKSWNEWLGDSVSLFENLSPINCTNIEESKLQVHSMNEH